MAGHKTIHVHHLTRVEYDLSAAVAGRHTHPVGMAIGGFSFVHDRKRLEEMQERLAAAEADIRAYVPTIAGSDTDRLTHQMEILVRAYDPCISCSTHVIDLADG